MATRSPTPFHSFWGAYATGGLPTSGEVEVGDTAFDTTLGQLVICTAVGPVVWTAVGGGVASVSVTAPITDTGTPTAPNVGISAATTLAAGSMSAADKTKLDGLPSSPVASVGATAPIASSGGTTPTISITAATTLAAGSMSAADKTKLDKLTVGFDLSFQGENTGTNALVIGAVYLPAITLTTSSRVLLGVVGAGTATLRLVEQATSTVVATWTRTGALTDVALAAPTAALAAGWYVFDLAGSAAGTVTRCYGAHLE